ncbi:MAG: hypothetical protein SA339_04290 [Methanomassiliicoccus sp.]|nr:hypothetical protein [Methanomassiliicoccus sp.]
MAAFSFVLMTLAIISVYNAPMGKYEYSVYQSTPAIFWIAIILGIVSGIATLIFSYGKSRFFFSVGLFQLLITNFVLITLYLYRGFIYLERFDSQTYVGFGKDIVQLGSIPDYNFYPIGSLIMAMTGMVTGQSVVMMSQLFPALFFTAYTLGILCWARAISTKPLFVTSMMMAAIPIFFAWYIPTIYHETWCVLMLPFFFFILQRCTTGKASYKALAGLMVLFFVFGHPLVAVGALLVMFITLLTQDLSRTKVRSISPSFLLFCVVILFGWIVFNAGLVRDLQNIVEQLMGLAVGASTLGTAQGQSSQMGILSIVQSILVVTVDDLIYILLSLWVGIIILKNGWRTHPMTVTMACFLGGAAFLAVMVVFTYTHNPFRMINLNFTMIFTIPLVGYLLYTFRKDKKRYRSQALAALIVVCMVATVFTMYQDPLEVYPNGALAKSEVVGNNWLITEQENGSMTYVVLTNPIRFTSLSHDEIAVRQNSNLWNITEASPHLDPFLNANRTESMQYLIFSDYDVLAYTRTWAAADKYNASDFGSVTWSTEVNHVYMSDCLTTYTRA